MEGIFLFQKQLLPATNCRLQWTERKSPRIWSGQSGENKRNDRNSSTDIKNQEDKYE